MTTEFKTNRGRPVEVTLKNRIRRSDGSWLTDKRLVKGTFQTWASKVKTAQKPGEDACVVTMALVEMENGQVEWIFPETVRFLDRSNNG